MDDGACECNGAINYEIKVRCAAHDLADIRRRLVTAGASPIVLGQIDTYFAVPTGRLKLRQIAGPADTDHSAELIGYTRSDRVGARWSAYNRVSIAPTDVPSLLRAMAATIGIRAVVTKFREVGLLRHTRVHLDRVEDLGCFVELETVVSPGMDDAAAPAELAEVSAMLGLERFPVIAGSYADLADVCR